MDSCVGVGQDLDKALAKFNGLGEHSDRVLGEAIELIENLREEFSKISPEQQLDYDQSIVVREAVQKCKEAIQRLASDHRDLHASVSRVGKSIDRHFIADFGAVAPRAEQFCSDENRPYMEQSIAQHLYRQGLDDAASTLIMEAGLEPVERAEPFAELQRTGAALANGDTGPALQWLEAHKDSLHHSPLPFTLHRMHFLKLAREQGVSVAVAYARDTLSRLASRHERELAAAVCALAWLNTDLPPPPHYAHLLDEKARGIAAGEMFVREACLLLRLAPLSPLAGGVQAGCRMLPALHDIRNKMSHPHVVAAWAEDLPLGVDVGSAGGGYHSVFACPILRQQASEHNPPMRLLCGHVISRDALNKLAQGVKLKCPYCPMEQSPSEARQIYFS